MASWGSTCSQPREELQGESDLKRLKYPHAWAGLNKKCARPLCTGRLFWAALKNPHYPHVADRPYLIVGEAFEDVAGESQRVAIAVVGLESNGGLGRTCYATADHKYIIGIKMQESEIGYNTFDGGTSVFEQHEREIDEKDLSNLYISDWSTPDWKLKPGTIADMSTVLVIKAPRILCHKSGELSMQSLFKIATIYENFSKMDPEVHRIAMRRKTPRIRVDWSTLPEKKKEPKEPSTRYRPDINPQPFIYIPGACPLRFNFLSSL